MSSPHRVQTVHDELAAPNPINIRFVRRKNRGIRQLSRKDRAATRSSLQQWPDWEKGHREPYHEYVHKLVDAGWLSLNGLDQYLQTDVEDENLVISVIDIMEDLQIKRHPDLRDEVSLKSFLRIERTKDVKVRLFMAEQSGPVSSAVIEALGSALDLDPRYFHWAVFGRKGHILSPAQRNRAPYTSIPFHLLKLSKSNAFEFHNMRVSVYVKPDIKNGDNWTGLLIFDSHVKIDTPVQALIDPPPYDRFKSIVDVPTRPPSPLTFREIYLSTFSYINAEAAIASPFYAIHFLFKLSSFTWSQALNTVRERDQRCNEISTTSVGQTEDIQHTLDIINRGGSLAWKRPLDPAPSIEGGAANKLVKEAMQMLKEDFEHLVREANNLWETRRQMAAVRNQRREKRVSALTNAFTFGFAPISILSGIYGMNVSEISGSNQNPNIWTFFVAVVGLSGLIVILLTISEWVAVNRQHNRRAGVKEVLYFALGKR